MATVMKQDFFNRPTLEVAEELLGKFLVKQDGDVQTAFMIKEVEAYDGFEDLASHAHVGKTARNKIMFGPAGFWYVYLIYGMYWMLNIVTGPEDFPAAILIRTVGDFDGPGKLTKKMGIDKSFHEKIAVPETCLWIEDRSEEEKFPKFKIQKTPRIGVDYAGEIWSQKPYRFLIQK